MSSRTSLFVAMAMIAFLALGPVLALGAFAMSPDTAGPGAAASLGPTMGPVLPGPPPWLPAEPARQTDPKAVEAFVEAARAQLPRTQQSDPYAVIDQCVTNEMTQTNTPGASIAIALDGVITYTKGYGVKHKENGGAIDQNTMFRIGSTTKMMTAAAVMKLVDQGEVDLHAPITTYLPDLQIAAPWNASSITPWNLLTHSGGLPDNYFVYDEASFDQLSLEQWGYTVLPYTPLNAPPGTFWNYANPNFSLAGLIVQELTGQLAVDYIEDEIWAPAGMPLTTFDPDKVTQHGDFAYGHYGNDRLTPDRWRMPALAPAGTAFSTPTEMVTWALTLQDGGRGVISPESAAAMQQRQIGQGYYDGADYGFGIFVTDYTDITDTNHVITVYDHGGNVQGWSSQLFWVPERGLTFSILANTMTSLGNSSACVLRELGAVTPKLPTDRTTDPSTWGPFEGVYAMMNQVLWDFTLRVQRVEDRLVMTQLDLGSVLPLVQVLRNTFFIDSDLNGEPDPATAVLDYTFIHDRDNPDKVPWLRNRLQVGQRVGQFPAWLGLQGTQCGSLPYTADLDMPNLAVKASGLVPPGGRVQSGVPITQTSPTDPTTASFKQDVQIHGEAGLFMLVLVPQAGDNIELYLLHDVNEDTQFTFPDEVEGVGLAAGGNARILLMSGRQPAGRYQIWAHGTSIRGSGHTFDLQTTLVDGDQLVLPDPPTSAVAGAAGAVQVCADDVDGLEGPMVGLVEFAYGSPPRRVRIPVSWTPAAPFSIYLPWVRDRVTLGE